MGFAQRMFELLPKNTASEFGEYRFDILEVKRFQRFVVKALIIF